jgi:hypothetical protein
MMVDCVFNDRAARSAFFFDRSVLAPRVCGVRRIGLWLLQFVSATPRIAVQKFDAVR